MRSSTQTTMKGGWSERERGGNGVNSKLKRMTRHTEEPNTTLKALPHTTEQKSGYCETRGSVKFNSNYKSYFAMIIQSLQEISPHLVYLV